MAKQIIGQIYAKKGQIPAVILVLMYRFGSKFNVKANSKYILTFKYS